MDIEDRINFALAVELTIIKFKIEEFETVKQAVSFIASKIDKLIEESK